MIGHDKIEYASLTDVGVRRSHNQDAHDVLMAPDLEKWQECGHVFVVADGMGAHAVGELASELAVKIVPHNYFKHAQQGAIIALRKAIAEANASIHNKGQQNREFEGMGTTTTTLVLRPEGAWVGHVGDSRAYRVRGGVIEQLSFDHSLQWELAKRQGIDPNGLQGIPSNVIVRSLGPEAVVQVDVEGPYPVEDGDVFVLCSDGLSGQVTDSELGATVAVMEPKEACQFLVDLANLRGGPDNITVVVARVGTGIAPPTQPAKQTVSMPRVPWPFVALVSGVMLAGIAIYLAGNKEFGWSWGVTTMVLALGALVAGTIGLFATHTTDKKRRGDDVDEPVKPRVHSRKPCRIERALVDRLGKAAITLKQRIEEKKWDTNWAEYHEHFDRGHQMLKDNKLVDAFREFCRSMRPLNLTLKELRRKEEVFQPVWDKGQ